MEQPGQHAPVYGRNAVAELLKSGKPVDTVLLADTMDPKQAGYFTALAKEAGAVVKTTRLAKLDTMCGGLHQGVAALAAQVEYCTLQDILETAAQAGEPPFILLADGVEDPHNLGALLRTALLCGVHGVVIPKRGASAVTAVAVKASAGAAAHMPVARVPNIGEAVRRLKQAGVFVYAADAMGAAAFSQDLTGPFALVMGSEGKGVSPLVKKLCDGVLALPVAAHGTGVDSFNVSVAGGILLYEAYRQRTEKQQ